MASSSSSTAAAAAAATASFAPAPAFPAWLGNMQQQFMEGKRTNVIIRISLPQEDSEGGAGRIVDIPYHSVVLTARSAYFNSSLGGEWVENQKKIVEIALEDQQAVDDLRLLLKLNYSSSCINDNGCAIDKPTRLRLIFLANAFEFKEAVKEWADL